VAMESVHIRVQLSRRATHQQIRGGIPRRCDEVKEWSVSAWDDNGANGPCPRREQSENGGARKLHEEELKGTVTGEWIL
jgi:hypothetical protein